MKKIIFYATKSEQQNCLTFSCLFNAGFSSFFRTNRFTKKLVSFATLLLLVFTQATTYGQLVGSSVVKANFGVDGDVYANLLQFPNIAVPPVPIVTPAAGTDDWFVNTTLYPGSGLGVIDQTLPVPGNNTAFERRQSVTTPTFPFPFPVVNGYLWLDAVYGRDNYVVGGSAEKSYFGGSGDKNSDNPSSWNIGLSGSVPQKDDLIDVFAHLRGEGPKAPTVEDPRPFTTLWAYAGASIAVTNGNKHVDFEFFRTEVTIDNLTTPGSTGADGGRTAFTFNPDGSVNVPGTIIISVDYTNGGTVPQVRIRVWMDETVFNNFDNSAPLRPFTVDKGTAFEKGTDSGTFGYAAILENVGATDIWGRVNDTASTLGPPWGTFAGAGPDAVTDFQALQFVEIGINLTAFGLDKRGDQSPCSNILGSLIVKTRASGGGPNEGAFGSELKDFAGPFLFGNTGTPPEPTVPNKVACETGATGSATVDLTTGADGDDGVITYYANADFTGQIMTPSAFSAPIGVTTIYVRSERLSNPGCFGDTSFTVTVTDNPDITVQNLTACETGETGAASVDLTAAILTNPDGGVITFYNSLADAQNEANAVSSPTSVTVASSPRTFWIRAEAGTTNCYSTESFTVTVTDNPDITVQNLTACETDETGAATVTLTDAILTNPDGGVITFYNSLADAQNEVNAVASPTSVTSASSPRTFWVRAEAGTTNCYSTASFTVTITDNPDITVQNLTVCETGTSGAASVDLTDGILTNSDGGLITFHNSLADAQNDANAVASPTSVTIASSPRTFWVRAEAGTCYSTESFTVTVTDNPDVTTMNLESCESEATGAATFDLDDGVTDADGGTISFHTSEADAIAGINPIAGKDAYSASNGVNTIWVRSSNGSCFGTAMFTITVNPNPELMITNPATVCEGETVDLTAAAVTAGSTLEGGDLSYWTDAAATIELATPSAVMAGTYYIKVLTTAGCMDIEPVMVTDQPCGGPLCTYTQGYYGNLGGMSCADGEQFTTMDLITKALESYGGTMQIGLPGHSVLLSNTDADKDAIVAVLPGGGSSYVLLAGDPHISALPASYLKKGTLNNTLLAQTITLGLNLGIDSQLGDFVLQSGTLATAAPEGGCGSDIPMPRSCSAEGYVPVINEFQYFTIPDVVDLLPVKTVQGLFDMANYALGGGDLSLYPGITLSALANAVDVINNAFDGCRISMGYEQTPLVCLTSDPQEFVAFEVPIVNNQLNIKYKFSYVSDVTIDVFDAATGAKVYSKTDSNSYLDKEVTLNYNFNTGTQKVYIVRLTTKLGHSEQKVLSSN